MTKFIKRILNRETISYVIFGVLTTVVDFGAFGILHYGLSINEIVSNTIAWIAAVIFSYVSSKLFVFDSRSFKLKVIMTEFPSFVLSRVLTLLLTDAFLIFAGYIHMNMMLAKALISIFVIIINYVFSKLIIFKKQTGEDNI